MLSEGHHVIVNNFMAQTTVLDKINHKKLPKHIAIIMDGNGRWAKSKGKERTFGHRSAINAVRSAIKTCRELNIPYLTLYTFSSENWNRPEDEVNMLMNFLAEVLLQEAEEIFEKGLRLHVIGEMDKLPEMVRELLNNVIELTSKNTKGNLILALSYGSQNEILKAVKEISGEVKNGEISIEDIDEKTFNKHLYTKDFPAVDLLIRTSGEVRVSNFMLWQIAYAELQFLDILWPDFNREIFLECILKYQEKERRYGKTSEQLQNK